MDRPTFRNGEIRTSGGAGMPRAPLSGVGAGIAGLLWAALGLVLAAWTATAALDPARAFQLAFWGLGHTGLSLPWSHEEISGFAMDNLPFIAIAAAVALLLAWSNLPEAPHAFRPGHVSHDGP